MSWFETAEQRRKRLEREAAQKSSVSYASPSQSTSGDDGFAFGLATGVPIPFTAASVAGAMLHDTVFSSTPSCDTSSSYNSPSIDTSSSCSFDSSSSSSFDSGSGF